MSPFFGWFLQLLGFSALTQPILQPITQSTINLEWIVKPENGNIPSTAIQIKPTMSSIFYFCEVTTAEGQKIPGTLKSTDNSCKYESNGSVTSSTEFSILSNPNGAKIDYKYRPANKPPPSGAVKCNEGSYCFLGKSVYNDGICEELPGKIVAPRGQLIMTTSNNKVKTCGSILYLIKN
ncbi:hypothetical protein SNE40_018014 [Patella caerulea]|uniref:Uncharacterized protein n=1 Tax=Patella caerulea TaxID=87958 RepID=A0AAN8PL86_PATCE